MTQEAVIQAVVFDLDGVIRHWDAQHTAAIEARHGLAQGKILATAFSPELGPAVVTGRLTWEQWVVEVGAVVGHRAATEWQEGRGRVDPEAVDLVRAVRAGGITVGLLSNATTRLEDDLDHLGLAGEFDHVFNTARLGVCKPDPATYRRVLDHLDLPAHHVVFTDDTPGWAQAATDVGMHGFHFTAVDRFRQDLRALGVRC